MQRDKVIKLIVLNTGIAFFEIIIFSEGLIGLEIGSSPFQTALGITILVMSIIIFLYGNYKLLFEKEKKHINVELKSIDDCVDILKQHQSKKTFKNQISTILTQIERFHKKKETIRDILLQKFNKGEMSYSKFDGAVMDVESVLYINIKSIINKLNAFDEEDYFYIKSSSARGSYSEEFIKSKMEIYEEFISYINESIEDDEQILLKLDKLLLEISRFNSLEDGEIENMSAIREIDELINNTKFFR
ncbi:MAG: hypothetical protein ACLFPF_07850 [Halanaerobiales bacterium]